MRPSREGTGSDYSRLFQIIPGLTLIWRFVCTGIEFKYISNTRSQSLPSPLSVVWLSRDCDQTQM